MSTIHLLICNTIFISAGFWLFLATKIKNNAKHFVTTFNYRVRVRVFNATFNNILITDLQDYILKFLFQTVKRLHQWSWTDKNAILFCLMDPSHKSLEYKFCTRTLKKTPPKVFSLDDLRVQVLKWYSKCLWPQTRK